MTGNKPYSYFLQDTVVLARVHDGDKPARERCLPTVFPDLLWSLMERCWDHNPSDRPEITAVRQQLEVVFHGLWGHVIKPCILAMELQLSVWQGPRRMAVSRALWPNIPASFSIKHLLRGVPRRPWRGGPISSSRGPTWDNENRF